MSLRDKVKTYDKKYGSGNFWKPEEGQNQIRFLTEPELYDDEYEGGATGSFIAYILVRDSGEDSFALFTLPKSLVRWLADQEDLGKFSGYPMPFDVMLFKQTGKKVTYVSVAVEPANSPAITGQQQAVLTAAKPIAEVAEALAKKKAGKLKPEGKAIEGHEVPALGSPQQKKNAAEVNPMFTAIKLGIENADSVERLNKAAGMIAVSQGAGSIDEFEADMLKQAAAAKGAALQGDKPGDDIKVEDIPF